MRLIASILLLISYTLAQSQQVDSLYWNGEKHYTTNSINDLRSVITNQTNLPEGKWILLNRDSVPLYKWNVKDGNVHGYFYEYSGTKVCNTGQYSNDSLWSFLGPKRTEDFKIGKWTECLSTFDSNGVRSGAEVYYDKWYTCYVSDRVTLLIDSIEGRGTIESKFLGPFGAPSEIYQAADTLNTLLQLDEQIHLMQCADNALKFYLFNDILKQNEYEAKKLLLAHANDSSLVSLHQTCVMYNSKLNAILFERYAYFIHRKYALGGNIILAGELYPFPEKNKKVWKQKRKELIELAKTNKIDTSSLDFL